MTEDDLAAEFVTDGSTARLCVATCPACGATVFPRQQTCPRCLADEMRPEFLDGPGALWSWTVQRFAPKAPYAGTIEAFRPYGVGYVSFGNRVLVEGRLTGDPDAAPPRIGQAMSVVVEHIPTPSGKSYATFAFAPAGSEA